MLFLILIVKYIFRFRFRPKMAGLFRFRLYVGRKRKFIFRLFLFYGRKSKIHFQSASSVDALDASQLLTIMFTLICIWPAIIECTVVPTQTALSKFRTFSVSISRPVPLVEYDDHVGNFRGRTKCTSKISQHLILNKGNYSKKWRFNYFDFQGETSQIQDFFFFMTCSASMSNLGTFQVLINKKTPNSGFFRTSVIGTHGNPVISIMPTNSSKI